MSAAPAADALFAAAVRQHHSGDWDGAARLYAEVLSVAPRHAASRHLLGVMALERGRAALAIGLIGEAIALDALAPAYHRDLGHAQRMAGRLEAAAASYTNALHLRPDQPEVLEALGATWRALGRLAAAVASYQHLLRLRPGCTRTLVTLGNVLLELRRLPEAAACYRAALAAAPALAEAHNNLGNVLRGQGALEAAIASYRRAIAAAPDFAEAHMNLGMALLARGDFAEGWAEHEWRWRTPLLHDQLRGFAQPLWRGEAAAGRTLLLHGEQGLGDTLQFCRYAALAAAAGFRVILEVDAALVRLLRGLEGADRVVARGEALPDFDVHAPLLSAPCACATALASIPAPGAYLHADPQATDTWRARLPDGRKVGLVWAGAPRAETPALAAVDRRRSLPFALLAPLFAIPGLHFVSLQKDTSPPPGAPVADFMAEMRDFADTAALVAALDLVIAVDTAVAHLAASLGRPVWLLDRFDHCWRWLAGRRDSPWYPTLRIYRQPAEGAWAPVLAEVAGDLARL